MPTTPVISVIVPVYKAERYLNECIDSILAQTFSDFELILVDDGSPDRSGEICDQYAAKDSRIRVIHKPNGGVSSARNAGLDVAKGEWITFIDADDTINKNTFEVCELNSTDNNDLIIFGCNNSFGADLPGQAFQNKNDIQSFLESFLCTIYVRVPWGKFYKRDILMSNNIIFDEKLRKGEDRVFLYQYFNHVDKLKTISQPLYDYRPTPNGLSGIYLDMWNEYGYYFRQLTTSLNKLIPDQRISPILLTHKLYLAFEIVLEYLDSIEHQNLSITTKEIKRLAKEPLLINTLTQWIQNRSSFNKHRKLSKRQNFVLKCLYRNNVRTLSLSMALFHLIRKIR